MDHAPKDRMLKEVTAKFDAARKAFEDELDRLLTDGQRLCSRWADDSCRKLRPVGDPEIAQKLVSKSGERGALKVPGGFDFDDVWRGFSDRMGNMVMASSRWKPKKSGQATIDYAIHCIVDELVTNARGEGNLAVVLAWDLPGGWIRIVDEREWFDYETRVVKQLTGTRKGIVGEHGRRKIDRTGGGGMGLSLVRMLSQKFDLELRHRYLRQHKAGNEFHLICHPRKCGAKNW